jgi:hypothetical protein
MKNVILWANGKEQELDARSFINGIGSGRISRSEPARLVDEAVFRTAGDISSEFSEMVDRAPMRIIPGEAIALTEVLGIVCLAVGLLGALWTTLYYPVTVGFPAVANLKFLHDRQLVCMMFCAMAIVGPILVVLSRINQGLKILAKSKEDAARSP